MILTFGNKTPNVHPEAFVAPTADLIGNVTVGKGSSLWFGAVIRSDMERIEIGENTSIQDNCTLHADEGLPCIIGNNVTVGHNAIVHGCTVGDNTVIGMHSTILNGAVIGKNCLIGAGAVVKENSVIPDNSLVVGIPAKIIRTLDDANTKKQIANAEEYAKLGARYRSLI